ncbi:histidinol-phosphate transaminase [Octadecabacter sp. 1_MG-2023]|uniref:histidinol-phosphate transaminase n=1 Tax=unclassified Octadecabacter TaxID=196158 RepID=UPI001C09F97D|nr:MULTISPECIES: histidinol-phosphate transaminase [unclassified Octadecabacter]MBU2991900.1 histidinol-phosphate transaminase [Octadecabacter sp. B2R22]MDO6735874.1 histidinol-phosphate transaminase [Octadecabacter sp. 1_MG-2023]
MAITPQPGIMDIDLYVGGKSHVDGLSNVLKLSSNENPLGSSDAAKDAVVRASHTMNRYPSSDHASLREAIGDVWGLDPERIICGAGSDEIIAFLCQAYAGQGDEVIYTEHGFAMYRIGALAVGATPVEVAERERVVDVDAILAACTKKTKLVFIANPANPTGTMIGEADATRLAEGLPEQAILVLDGAYAEYVDGYDAGKQLVESRDNVVMTRTFSKIYGLGGLRVGYGYAPKPILDVLNRIRGPFNVSSVGLVAAEAAVRDTAHTEKCRAENAKQREWMAGALAEMGLPSDTSTANFILVRFPSADEAKACHDALANQGILLRYVANYGLPNCIRITVGDEASCRRVVHAIGQFKGAS